MKRTGRFRIRKAIGLILVLFALLFMSASTPTSAVDRAPDFKLTDTDGNNWTLRQFEDKKIVLLDLMAIACESCKIVERNLKEVYPRYKDDVFIISIDVWVKIETESELRNYKAEHNVPWPMAMDTDDVFTKYAAQEIAKVVIIKYNGRMGYENTGVTSVDQLKEHLDKALEDKLVDVEVVDISLWLLAIFAGVASFFSPCAFPMFPGYMAFYFKKHMERKEKKLNVPRAAASGAIAAGGIIFVYLVIGGAVVYIGTSVIPVVETLELIIGVIILLLGGLMMTNIQYDRIIDPFRKLGAKIKERKRKDGKGSKETGFYAGLFIYGVGYGGAAAACTLPVFLAVILAGIASGTEWTGFLVLLCYTTVAAILMICATIAIAVAGHMAVQKMAKYTNLIKKVSGFVLVLAGIYLILFWMSANGYVSIPGIG